MSRKNAFQCLVLGLSSIGVHMLSLLKGFSSSRWDLPHNRASEMRKEAARLTSEHIVIILMSLPKYFHSLLAK